MKRLCIAVLTFGASSVAAAAEIAPGGLPTLPQQRPVWAGVMVLIVAGLFIAAAAIGPLVAVLMPPESEPVVQDDHDADESHGAHGRGH